MPGTGDKLYAVGGTFIWTFGDGNSILLGSMLFLLLFGDLPFITTATPFLLIRENKDMDRRQFLYIVGACMLSHVYPGFYRNTVDEISFPKNTWSYTVNAGIFGKRRTLGIPVKSKTLEMSRPYQTMCCNLCSAVRMHWY